MNVTVIVAVHNCEKYIGRCIRSLIEQSYPREKFEILVVDDGSTDNTVRVLEPFGEWIRVIRSEKQQGLPATCNSGIRNALSRYVVRVDADDYVHEDFLRVGQLFLSLNTCYNAVAFDYYIVNDREDILERKNANSDPIACGILFKKDDLVDIGLYDEEFRVHEDIDLRLRFIQQHTIGRIELPMYRYRRHEDNMTNNIENGRIYSKLLEVKHGVGLSDHKSAKARQSIK